MEIITLVRWLKPTAKDSALNSRLVNLKAVCYAVIISQRIIINIQKINIIS